MIGNQKAARKKLIPSGDKMTILFFCGKKKIEEREKWKSKRTLCLN